MSAEQEAFRSRLALDLQLVLRVSNVNDNEMVFGESTQGKNHKVLSSANSSKYSVLSNEEDLFNFFPMKLFQIMKTFTFVNVHECKTDFSHMVKNSNKEIKKKPLLWPSGTQIINFLLINIFYLNCSLKYRLLLK